MLVCVKSLVAPLNPRRMHGRFCYRFDAAVRGHGAIRP
jgi:hypothetical protein